MKKYLILALVLFLALVLLVMTTNPSNVPVFMLVLPFVILFLSFFSLLLYLFSRKGDQTQLKIVRNAAFLAGVPIMVLILQSIGQLTPRDVFTILAIFLLGYFYVSRLTSVE